MSLLCTRFQLLFSVTRVSFPRQNKQYGSGASAYRTFKCIALERQREKERAPRTPSERVMSILTELPNVKTKGRYQFKSMDTNTSNILLV